MKILYVTGGIATGKSVVIRMLKKRGFKVVDADELSHQATKKGTTAYKKIAEMFGNEILDGDGQIDRRKLGKLAFHSKDTLKFLENVIHPEVIKALAKELKKFREEGAEWVAVEIPLLFELNLPLKPVLLVWARRETQIKRLMERDGLSEEEARARLSAQMDIDKKRKLADFVLDNDGNIRKTEKELAKMLDKISQVTAKA